LADNGNKQCQSLTQTRTNQRGAELGNGFFEEENFMNLILLIILIILIVGLLPTWPYSAGWGYYPSGGLGLILLIVIILLLLGRI
jgi:hypothetical protein